MPNWCKNELRVTGDKELIKKFDLQFKSINRLNWDNKTRDKKSSYSFEAFIPIPQEIITSGYEPKGYYWSIDNWGTKWDIILCNFVPDISSKTNWFCIFETAWGSPLEVVKAMGLAYPELSFKMTYGEAGCVFYGEYTMEKGLESESNFEANGDTAIPYLKGMNLWFDED